jgi:hypothetical protein
VNFCQNSQKHNFYLFAGITVTDLYMWFIVFLLIVFQSLYYSAHKLGEIVIFLHADFDASTVTLD